jgi:uncharacterized phage protein gp47/JayE
MPLTSSGFEGESLQEIKTSLETDLKDAFSQDIQLTPQSAFGQFVGVLSEREFDNVELIERVYSSAYLSGASGVELDRLIELAGVERDGGVKSTVELTLSGTPGTIIQVGSASRDPATGTRWIHTASATIGAGGSVTGVAAEAEVAGAIAALSGAISEIETAIAGWTGVTNPLDATVGQSQESDTSVRAKYIRAFRSGGGSSVEAIRARLLRVTGVTNAIVVENASDFPDAEGRPPHSIEAVVEGGTDAEIAAAIWASKASGAATHGDLSATTIDTFGVVRTVNFSRPIDVPIYIDVDYIPLPGFSSDGEDLILAAILDFGTTLTIGDDVYPFQIIQNIETENLQNVVLRVGTAENPSFSSPVSIDNASRAVFDSSRIVFTEV